MNIAIVSKHKENIPELQNLFLKYGALIVKVTPDVVISHGGDGTLLRAERLYPGIPKIPIRDTSVCKKCYANGFEEIIDVLKNNKFSTKNCVKLQATFQNKKITALNDIIIRNLIPSNAIRFDVKMNKKMFKNIIADGVVVSTPFGSTGYFHSITKTSFKKGIGFAINNATIKTKTLIAKNPTIVFVLHRGIAQLSADNDPRIIKLKPGSKVTITLSSTVARILMR
jgi:NAD+ kinase